MSFPVQLPRPPDGLHVRENVFQDLIDYVALIIHLAEVQTRHERDEKAPNVVPQLDQTGGGVGGGGGGGETTTTTI